MASLCSVCNRLIENENEICPYCGAFVQQPAVLSADTSSVSDYSDTDEILDSMLNDIVLARSSLEESETILEPSEPDPEYTDSPEPDTENVATESSADAGEDEPGRIPEPAPQHRDEYSDGMQEPALLDGDEPPDDTMETTGSEETGSLYGETEYTAEKAEEIDGFVISETDISEHSQDLPEEISDSDTEQDNADQTSGRESFPGEKRKNALEDSFDSPPKEVRGNGMFRFLVIVVILAVLALLTAIVMRGIMPLQQINREKQELIDYMEGAWISDKFAFFDSTSKDFVEVLIIDGDGNFEMLYAVPDESIPDGWRDGKWRTEDRVEGHVDYVAAEQRLLLLYEADGENYFFERFFISMEEDMICLREFYDAANENFYDVILHRIKL